MPASIDPERFRRAEAILHELFEVELEERDRRLAALAEEDAAMAEDVRSLLAADEQPAELLDLSARRILDHGTSEEPETDSWIGRRVGAYCLLSKLGEGGMGVVYLASRADEVYDNAVAIKLLRGSLAGEVLESRFRRERQILAQLDHPNIARLHDGGSTPDGVPYFVMDYIEGTALDHHCDNSDLDLRARIDLFLQVCSAVAYAHRRLIVHRDIKPGNILVTTDGVPKLLDFGIAKLVEGDGESETTVTDAGQRPLTPRYASPEQIRGEAITTASDTYSLGVSLYRLLTGRLPSPASSKEETPRPSRNIAPDSVGGRVGASWERQLRGDLDIVLLKSLAADPEERYASVESLVEDLNRWLDGRPILARPPSTLYRLRRFAGRNRLASGLIAALVTLILGYAATATIFSLRLASEHQRVQVEQQRAEQASDFLAGLFDVADPESGRGSEITAQQVLSRGAERAERELQDQPELQARLFFTIGGLYAKLGLFADAQRLFERSVELRTGLLGPDHLETLVARTEFASTSLELGDFAMGEEVLEDVELRFEQLVLPADTERARNLRLLGAAKIRRGDLSGAKGVVEQSLTLRQAASEPDPLAIGNSLHLLGLIAINEEELDRAKDLLTQAVASRSQIIGRLHPNQLASLKSLASIAQDQGDLTAAQGLGEEILALEVGLWGEEHPKIAFSLSNLGMVAMERGDLEQAESLFQRALEMRRTLLGPEHPSVGPSLSLLAALRDRQGRSQEAEQLYREALLLARNTFGPRSPILGRILEPLGKLLLRLERPLEAEAFLREGYELRLEALGSSNLLVVRTGAALGESLVALRRFDEAEPLLLDHLRWLEERGDTSVTVQAAERLVVLYESWSRTDRAVELRRMVEAVSGGFSE